MIRALVLALLLAVPAVAAPKRVASLNLCSDELALLLAAPGQLVSVSRLGADRNESVLAGRAKGLFTNRGRVTDVVALSPDLVITSSGDPNAAATARRLGFAVLELPQPQTLDEVRSNVRTVARALGRDAAGAALIAEMDRDLAGNGSTPALLVSGGGLTVAPDGLAAAYLRHSGLIQQDVPRGMLSLERLLAAPPKVLVITDYRQGQTSLNQAWLEHPALAALKGVRVVHSDGRPWTCLGPTLAPEIARLRAAVAP